MAGEETWPFADRWAARIAEALHAAHRQGAVREVEASTSARHDSDTPSPGEQDVIDVLLWLGHNAGRELSYAAGHGH